MVDSVLEQVKEGLNNHKQEKETVLNQVNYSLPLIQFSTKCYQTANIQVLQYEIERIFSLSDYGKIG